MKRIVIYKKGSIQQIIHQLRYQIEQSQFSLKNIIN